MKRKKQRQNTIQTTRHAAQQATPQRAALQPADIDRAYQKAESLFRSNDFTQAEIICRQIIAAVPKYTNAIHLLGVIAARSGQMHYAENLFCKAVSFAPDNKSFNKSLGTCYYHLKNNERAIACWEKAGIRDYLLWVLKYDTLQPETITEMRQVIGLWQNPPLISILMPVYNAPERWLRAAIESVRNQIYPNWELCIADDASTLPGISQILREYADSDSRIKVVFRESNGHISAASNSALSLATGDFTALLDQDDEIPSHALFFVAAEIVDSPDVRLIYSDEDKIDSRGMRSGHYFKCDWNPDLFLSHNMITHLGVYQTALMRKIGGFRVGYEGAQDYDLALRFIERIEGRQIHHIPHVLYHWRQHEDSTSLTMHAKSYAIEAAEKAINESFQRQGIQADAKQAFNVPGAFRVTYPIPTPAPLVTLIIPTRNGFDLLYTCIESILEKTDYPNFEIIVVDNQSDDPATLSYFQSLQDNPRVRVIPYDLPFNYSAINNMAVVQARGEIIGLLNNDLEVINETWLTEMVSHALRPEVGAVGARLWYSNSTLQHGGVIVGLGGVAGHAHKHFPRTNPGYQNRARLIQNFSAVTAACLVLRKQTFTSVYGLNGTDLTVAFNDIDLCLKIGSWLGLRVVWTPYAELFHHESASRGYENTPEKQLRFSQECEYMRRQWGTQKAIDKAYSPNLSLDTEDFSLAWPPRVQINESFRKYAVQGSSRHSG